MNIHRRTLLSTVPLGAVAALVGCGGPIPTPAQLVADVQGVLNQLAADLPLIDKAAPGLIPAPTLSSYESNVAAAQKLASTVAAGAPASSTTTTLSTVESYLNATLDGLAGFPGIPAPYNMAIAAAAVLAPEIEQFVNNALGTTSTKAALRAKAIAPTMTPAQARALLHIPTV